MATGWGVPVSLVGPQGVPGTANVIYSGWLYATNFADSLIDGSNFKVAYVNAPDITSSFLGNASIQVYMANFSFDSSVYA